ncbi:amidohydrolase [Halobacillus sp. Marseille-Q1614]|uniref:amidohydrolase n=1 Tax=Halobacillus sp. Marseille-Q1614 TaxID=2709134 RepID=UPI00156FF454|nr:amidohydrolase [Halobacillus sp. Marseille-Q1614]
MKVINNVKLFRPFDKQDQGDIYHVIVENGKFKEINQGLYQGNDGEVIDSREAALAPSFNDSHMHLLRFGLMDKELDLREVTSWKEMKEVVKDHYNQKVMEENEWIVGRGLSDDGFDDIDHLLNAKDIEELNYKKPAFFLHEDGHECVVNEEAMKIIREKDDLSQFPEEFIERDEDGNWSGRFKDTIVHFIKFHFRQKSKEEVKEAVKEGVRDLAENGITSAHTDDLNYVGSFETLWNAYIELEEEGKMDADVHLHHYIFNIEDLKNFISRYNKQTGDGTDRVKMGAIKIFLDGTQRLHTSALRAPYHDRPKTDGVLNYSQEELDEIIALADNHNLQAAMHAIGDRAVETAISAIEKAGSNKLRHRIIHAQVLAPDLLEKLAEVKPYLEIQPGFMMGEYPQTAEWVGEEREKYCNPWNTVYKMGIPFTCSSDCPIGQLSPITEMFAAVNRTDFNGEPKGGWIPEEKLSIDAIYQAYTETPAQLEFQEAEKGKLEEGYQADFVLLSDHPRQVEGYQLKDIRIQETWSCGEKVYSK